MKTESRKLVTKLAECVHVCNDCFNACLGEEDVAMMTECIKLCRECATVCASSLELIYHGAHFKHEMLSLCTDVCNACSRECRKHPMDHCRECADMCDSCAQECLDYENWLRSL